MPSLLGEWIVVTIVSANSVAVVTITLRAAELSNPAMLVRGYCLSRKLATDPIGFFGKHDLHAIAARRQCCRESAGAAADDQDVATQFRALCPSPSCSQHNCGTSNKLSPVQIPLVFSEHADWSITAAGTAAWPNAFGPVENGWRYDAQSAFHIIPPCAGATF